MTTGGFVRGTVSWGLGIEDTCVFSPDGTPLLDEHALTQHDQYWRSDLDQVAELGASFLRYGVSWPAVHVAPGRFEWTAFDRIVEYCTRQGIAIMADLVHYGAPAWLVDSFLAPEYPAVYADYVRAFGERYRDAVSYVTPVNEPLTTASFCGLRGVWPPYATGWDGWAAVTLGIAEGIQSAVGILRDVAPNMSIVHVEAASDFSSSEAALASSVGFHTRIGWLPLDLVLGRVDPSHDMHAWLVRQGINADRLKRLQDEPADIDVLGVNYYPDLTPRILESRDGQVVQRTYNRGGAGLASALRAFAGRYSQPLVVTETSIEGDDLTRAQWLTSAAAMIRHLAASGLDVRGMTWWPLLDFVDWSWASGAYVEEFREESLENRAETHGDIGFLRRMGLIRLDRMNDGTMSRSLTPAADAFVRVSGGRQVASR